LSNPDPNNDWSELSMCFCLYFQMNSFLSISLFEFQNSLPHLSSVSADCPNMQLALSCHLKTAWTLFVLTFLHLSVSLLNFVTETRQQENIMHNTATLSEARYKLAAASAGELVFFADGVVPSWVGQTVTNRVDIHDVTRGSWTTTSLSVARDGLAAASILNYLYFGGGWYY
jgi:hypothetical protein